MAALRSIDVIVELKKFIQTAHFLSKLYLRTITYWFHIKFLKYDKKLFSNNIRFILNSIFYHNLRWIIESNKYLENSFIMFHKERIKIKKNQTIMEIK